MKKTLKIIGITLGVVALLSAITVVVALSTQSIRSEPEYCEEYREIRGELSSLFDRAIVLAEELDDNIFTVFSFESELTEIADNITGLGSRVDDLAG